MLKLQFSGVLKKCEIKKMGQDTGIQASLCKKNYSKTGEAPTFTWINITVFKAPPFMLEKAKVGSFVAGCGDFTLRTYEKDGQKRQSADVRCDSFSVDFADSQEEAQSRDDRVPVVVTGTSDEPPF